MAHRGRTRLFLAAVVVAVSAWAFHSWLLASAGRFLTWQDQPEKCDVLVVLSGEEGDGLRLQEAARLYRQGLAPKIILGGGPRVLGVHETELSLPLALQLGLPREHLQAVPHDARTVWGEAGVLLPVMEKSGARSAILITSQPDARLVHTAFARLAGNRMRLIIRGVPSPWFDPSSWWYTREGAKRFFYAWVALVEVWLR